jgi:hypothetical protein
LTLLLALDDNPAPRNALEAAGLPGFVVSSAERRGSPAS